MLTKNLDMEKLSLVNLVPQMISFMWHFLCLGMN
jgi:hypothetical protein